MLVGGFLIVLCQLRVMPNFFFLSRKGLVRHHLIRVVYSGRKGMEVRTKWGGGMSSYHFLLFPPSTISSLYHGDGIEPRPLSVADPSLHDQVLERGFDTGGG